MNRSIAWRRCWWDLTEYKLLEVVIVSNSKKKRIKWVRRSDKRMHLFLLHSLSFSCVHRNTSLCVCSKRLGNWESYFRLLKKFSRTRTKPIWRELQSASRHSRIPHQDLDEKWLFETKSQFTWKCMLELNSRSCSFLLFSFTIISLTLSLSPLYTQIGSHSFMKA